MQVRKQQLELDISIIACPKKWLCTCAKSLQSCPTLCDTMDYSLPDSSVHGILQARILEWVATPDPPPVDLPDSEIKPASQADSLALSHLGSPQVTWEDPKSKCSLLTDKKDSKLVL